MSTSTETIEELATREYAEGNPKGSCAQSGAEAIHAAIKAELVKRGMAKTEVRACTSSCLDACWVGPTIAVEPDGFFYGRVTLGDVPEIVDALVNGTRVERLVLPPEDHDEKTARPGLSPLASGSTGPKEGSG